MKKNKLFLVSILLKFFSYTDSKQRFIAKGSRIASRGFSLGKGSRINGPIVVKGKGSCSIGNYCAFGENIRLITSNHNPSMLILQYRLNRRLGLESQTGKRKDIVVGHNVWIGDSVILLPGVKIGNGAIISAGAVVTKNVDPYSVVAGVPARFVKFRLQSSAITRLENTKWWTLNTSEIKNNAELIRILSDEDNRDRFHKTGTSTLFKALTELGYKV